MQYTTQQPVDPRQQMLNEFRTKALRGAQDQAKLTGLDEQYNRFTAQRDAPMAAPTKYGQLGLGAVLSNFVGSGMAKNKLDQIEPQRQAAMARVNEAKTALPLFNAKMANEQTDYTRGQDAATLARETEQQKYDRQRAEQETQYTQGRDVIGDQMKRENVELVSTTDPKDSIRAYKVAGKYYDPQTDEQIDGTGRREFKDKSGSTRTYIGAGKPTPQKDEYLNPILVWPDGRREFANGQPWDETLAKDYSVITQQAMSDKKNAEAWGRLNAIGAEEAAEKLSENAQLTRGLDQALDAMYGELGSMGAQTGRIAKFIPEVFLPEANKLLKNATDKLSLNDIGNYTFGALSDAEGQWLKDANLPRGLSEESTIKWIQRRQEGIQRVNAALKYQYESRLDNKLKDRDRRKVIEYILTHGGFKFNNEGLTGEAK